MLLVKISGENQLKFILMIQNASTQQIVFPFKDDIMFPHAGAALCLQQDELLERCEASVESALCRLGRGGPQVSN